MCECCIVSFVMLLECDCDGKVWIFGIMCVWDVCVVGGGIIDCLIWCVFDVW